MNLNLLSISIFTLKRKSKHNSYPLAYTILIKYRVVLYKFIKYVQVEESSGYDVISRTFTEREKCGLKQIQAFTLPMVAVPIRKHSGYRDLLAARSMTIGVKLYTYL